MRFIKLQARVLRGGDRVVSVRHEFLEVERVLPAPETKGMVEIFYYARPKEFVPAQSECVPYDTMREIEYYG